MRRERLCQRMTRERPLRDAGELRGSAEAQRRGAERDAARVPTGAEAERQPGELNESQKRRLSVTCEYIDRLLQDVEHILDAEGSKSPFPRYRPDIPDAEARALEGQIAALRSRLTGALAWQRMQARVAEIPASRAVMINLDYIGIAIEELKPRYMKGSGAVPEDAVEELNRVVGELRAATETMERSLLQAMERAGGEGAAGGDAAKAIAPE